MSTLQDHEISKERIRRNSPYRALLEELQADAEALTELPGSSSREAWFETVSKHISEAAKLIEELDGDQTENRLRAARGRLRSRSGQKE